LLQSPPQQLKNDVKGSRHIAALRLVPPKRQERPNTRLVGEPLLDWPQLLALLGLRIEPPSTLRLKREPLPVPYVLVTLAAMAAFGVLPYAEELLRDRRGPSAAVPRAARAGRIPKTGRHVRRGA
jgi:hypothetical protein